MGLKNLGTEKIAARPLDFIWILDTSGSMHGEKIASLNYAIKEAIPSMKEAASSNINADIMVRVLTFSTDPYWHIKERTPISKFEWLDISAKGLSNLGKALTELASVLDDDKMPDRILPPVLVLVTDGNPTDDYREGLDRLTAKSWGKKALRLSISVSDDVDINVLEDFIGNKQIKPIKVENANQLAKYLKVISTQVLSSVSENRSDAKSLFKFDFDLPEDDMPAVEAFDKF